MQQLDLKALGEQIADLIAEATEPLQKRIEQLEARQPEKGEQGPQGDPGADAEPVLVADVVAELVKSDLLSPVLDLYVEERVTKHFEDNPVPSGEKGEQGDPGKDAHPVNVTDVAKALMDDSALATLCDLHATEAVAKHFEANPVQHGRDGKDGDQGPKGDPGDRGEKGADGLDVKDLFRADGGRLMAVMSDGTTKDLGQFVGKDGEAGKDGRDGLGFEDVAAAVEDGFGVLKFKRGDLEQAVRFPLPTMKHIGFWQTGMSAKATETTTHDGSLWIALRDTKETPGYKSADWQLAARKGRDGADGKAPPKTGPVKLKGDGDA